MRRYYALAAMLLTAAAPLGCAEFNGPLVDSDWPDGDWPFPDTTGFTQTEFEWSGFIAAGDQIEIKGVSGNIRAGYTAGSDVEVKAAIRGPEGQIADVDIDLVAHATGVTICAVYPDNHGQQWNDCAPGDWDMMDSRTRGSRDVKVTFEVLVPAGVEFAGRAIAGNVEGVALRSNAYIITTAGNVDITTSELATASTTAGSVRASIGLPDWDRDLAFTAVSGNVNVEIPAATNADVDASVVSGQIDSDFSLTQVGPGRMQGTIGAGGPSLRIATVTGRVTLRRR